MRNKEQATSEDESGGPVDPVGPVEPLPFVLRCDMRVDCVTFKTDPLDGHVLSANIGLVDGAGNVANFNTTDHERFPEGTVVGVTFEPRTH